jgi:hypothetical protein
VINLFSNALSRILICSAMLLAVGLATPKAIADSLSVETLRDPLHPGSALNFTLSHFATGEPTTDSEIQITHSWSDTFAAGLTVPWVLHDNSGAVATQGSRLGGGSFGRMTADGLVRLAGDDQSYLNADFIFGFPFQTNAHYQKSLYATPLFGGTLTAHYRLSDFAFEFAFTDVDGFPDHEKADTNTYLDQTNTVFWVGQIFYFVSDRFDVRATYEEYVPTHTDDSEDNGQFTYILSTTDTVRRRFFGAGIDYAINRTTLLLSLDGDYLAVGGVNQGSILWTGRLKWIF